MADFEDVFDFADALFADLGDVDEAVNFVGKLDKGAKAGDFGDFACDDVADFVEAFDVFPWVIGELFDAKADALVGFVDAEHLGFHFFAFFEDFGGVVDFTCPG